MNPLAGIADGNIANNMQVSMQHSVKSLCSGQEVWDPSVGFKLMHLQERRDNKIFLFLICFY